MALLVAHYRALRSVDPQTLADIGCGGGIVLEAMEERVPAARLSGCDPAAAAVHAARARVPRADVQHGEEPPTGPLDGVLVHLTLGLWNDPVQSLSRVLEQLSATGVLYVVDLSAGARHLATAAALDDAERHYLEEQYAASLTVDELDDILSTAVERAQTSAGAAAFGTHTGTSPFGGFAFGTPQQLRLMTDPGVVKVLQSHAPQRGRVGCHTRTIPELIHGWVWREPRRGAKPSSTTPQSVQTRL